MQSIRAVTGGGGPDARRERKFNRRFLQLCSHYLLDRPASTLAAGWENGQVENQVGVARKRFFKRRLRFKIYAALNAWLLEQCVAYARAQRHPEIADRTIWDVFEAERPALIYVSIRDTIEFLNRLLTRHKSEFIEVARFYPFRS